LFFSCTPGVKLLHTQSLGLNGEIEKINYYGNTSAKKEVIFIDNSLVTLKVWKKLGYVFPDDAYYLMYENDVFVDVHWTNYYKGSSNFTRTISPQEFEFSFQIDKPSINYSFESSELNKNGDISKIRFFDIDSTLMKEWYITYEYDGHYNWTYRTIIEENKKIEGAHREIFYKNVIPASEVNEWNNTLDSLYAIHQKRTHILIEEAPLILENNHSLIKVNKIVSKDFKNVKNNVFKALELVKDFNITFGSAINQRTYYKLVEKGKLINKAYSIEYLLWSELSVITPSILEQGTEAAILS